MFKCVIVVFDSNTNNLKQGLCCPLMILVAYGTNISLIFMFCFLKFLVKILNLKFFLSSNIATYAYKYVSMYMCIDAVIWTTHICMYMHTYKHNTHKCTYMWACMYFCSIYTRVYTCVYG